MFTQIEIPRLMKKTARAAPAEKAAEEAPKKAFDVKLRKSETQQAAAPEHAKFTVDLRKMEQSAQQSQAAQHQVKFQKPELKTVLRQPEEVGDIRHAANRYLTLGVELEYCRKLSL